MNNDTMTIRREKEDQVAKAHAGGGSGGRRGILEGKLLTPVSFSTGAGALGRPAQIAART